VHSYAEVSSSRNFFALFVGRALADRLVLSRQQVSVVRCRGLVKADGQPTHSFVGLME
jgi:hypothetical protein